MGGHVHDFWENDRAVLVIVTSLPATTKVSGRSTKINEITARGVGVDGRENWSRVDPLGSRSLDTCGPFNYLKAGESHSLTRYFTQDSGRFCRASYGKCLSSETETFCEYPHAGKCVCDIESPCCATHPTPG